jgi:hypothetical protein
MNKNNSAILSFSFISIYITAFMITSCENPLSELTDDFGELSLIETMADWTGYSSASHSEDADADYNKLFGKESDGTYTTEVQRIDITIDNDYYEQMEEDMTELYGSFGSSGGVSLSDSDPIYVPVTVTFEPANGDDMERTWWYVGMRYKGNSSLRDAWQSGIHKLPFRLDFEEFDYIYEEIEGQRFWGFEKMTFSNGKDDDTLIRDKIASDFYREAGVEVAEVAFCRVYVDCGDGEGPVYWGLYSMIEDPSDQMLEEQFTDDTGNLYKPDDEENSTLDSFDKDWYEKKTNEDEDDWSDIKALITALDDAPDSTDDEDWQAALEEVFNVDHFLDYLAINNFIRNWDVYGSKAHNYYLYSYDDDDIENGDRLNWFPWDLNESFTLDDGEFVDECLSINDEDNCYDDDDWPLLYYVMHQDQYIADYQSKLEEYFTDSDSLFSSDYHSSSDETGTFTSGNTIEDQMTTYTTLISDYVIGDENGEIDGYTWLDSDSDFTDGLSDLIDSNEFTDDRFSSVYTYLNLTE